MLNMQCRLCCSSTALISLFSGKCRKNRDYIRKIVALTTGIEFQKSDIYKRICLACTIQIYNFYIFRTQSIENEKNLQVCTKNNENSRSRKIDAVNIDDIVLPDVEKLKENLAPWFISKQKYCESESTESDLNSITRDERNQDNTQPTLTETSSQCDFVQHTEIATQYESHSLEANTQTNVVATKTKKIQCGELQWRLDGKSKESETETSKVNINCTVKKLNKLTQCKSICVENCTQTEFPKTESKEYSTEVCVSCCSKKIQCNLCTCEKQVKPNSSTRTPTRLTKRNQELLNRSNNQIVSADGNIDHTTETQLSSKCRCDVLKFEVDTQTEEFVVKSIDIQCELININESGYNSFSSATAVADRINNSVLHMNKESPSELIKKGLLSKDEKTIKHESKRSKTSNNAKGTIQRYKTRKLAKTNHLKINKGLASSKRFKRQILVKYEESATQTEITCMENVNSKDYIKLDASGMLLKENYEVKHDATRGNTTTQIESIRNIPRTYGGMPQDETKESFTQTDIVSEKNGIESYNKETQCELYTVQKHTTRRLLKANTVQIQDISPKKYIGKFIESAIQTGESNMSALRIDIKHETEIPPVLSPVKCLSTTVDSYKNEALISPGLGYASPRSSNLLAIKDKIQHVIICPECDTTVYSNSEYKFHKKSHMQCNFCKKKFRSLKKTKLHIKFQCEVQRLVKMVPVVTLVRLESLTDIQNKYPECIELLKKYLKPVYNEENKDIKKVVRIRSKSMSDTDSIINCSACRSCFSVLHERVDMSIRMDKAVQVNFLLDTDLWSPLKFVYKNFGTKRNLMDSTSNDGSLFKKIKLSPAVNS